VVHLHCPHPTVHSAHLVITLFNRAKSEKPLMQTIAILI
jgi:hypothetical protein